MAILAIFFHRLEARTTLDENALVNSLMELLKLNNTAIWRTSSKDRIQNQILNSLGAIAIIAFRLESEEVETLWGFRSML